MKKKLTDRAIRAMPYESRLRHYEMEKAQMFDRISHLPAAEVARLHEELAKKWRI